MWFWQKIDAILAGVKALQTQGIKIMATLDDIVADVASESAVDDSIITLLNNIAQQLKDAGNDPAKLQAILDGIEANKKKIADAVTANTPSA